VTARAVRRLTVPAVLFVIAVLAAWPAPALAAGVALPGVEKQGSNDAGSPTEVAAGTWRDTIGPGNDHLFYAYHRTMKDSTVHFGVIASKLTDASEGVGISVTTPDSDDECDSDTGSAYGTDARAFSAEARVGLDPDDAGKDDEELDDACKTGTNLVIELSRGYGSDPVGDLDVALTIVEEAAVKDTEGLPAGAEIAEYQGPEGGEAVDDGQGGSLADPTPLEGGQSAKSTMQTGTSVVYAVPVGWGQTLDARVIANPVASDIFSGVGVTVLDPRYVADYATEQPGYLSSSEKATATAVSGPVRYLNRIDGEGPYLPGTYYVVVAAEVVDGSQVEVTFTLDVAVDGVRSGEPDYGTDDPFVFGDGSAGQTVEPDRSGGGWSPARLVAVAALTLVGAVSLGGGVFLLRRR
jgi:Ca-activated chloride channel family protein